MKWLAVLPVFAAVILLGCGGSGASAKDGIRAETASHTGSTTEQVANTTAGTAGKMSSAATGASQSKTNWEAAVQTVLGYYGDINQRSYKEAYRTWARDGAASDQSFKQFKRGYANTVAVSVLIGPSKARQTIPVKVPVKLISVVNRDGAPQRVKQYAGTYTVRQTSEGWRISNASIAKKSGKLPPTELSAPRRLVRAYYQEINRRHFARAYTFWEDLGQASNQTFAQFEQGFATTDHDVVEVGRPRVEGAAGSFFAKVPVVIVATNDNQTKQTFRGSYILRKSDVPPFNKLGWRIYEAKIAEH